MTRQQRDLQIQERKLWEMYNTIIELYGKDSAQAKGTKEVWEYINSTLKELHIPEDRKEKSILAIVINKAKHKRAAWNSVWGLMKDMGIKTLDRDVR